MVCAPGASGRPRAASERWLGGPGSPVLAPAGRGRPTNVAPPPPEQGGQRPEQAAEGGGGVQEDRGVHGQRAVGQLGCAARGRGAAAQARARRRAALCFAAPPPRGAPRPRRSTSRRGGGACCPGSAARGRPRRRRGPRQPTRDGPPPPPRCPAFPPRHVHVQHQGWPLRARPQEVQDLGRHQAVLLPLLQTAARRRAGGAWGAARAAAAAASRRRQHGAGRRRGPQAAACAETAACFLPRRRATTHSSGAPPPRRCLRFKRRIGPRRAHSPPPPQAFFAQIYSEAQSSRAAPGHHALARLWRLGLLGRHYTLNIDGLAEVVGMDTHHQETNPGGVTVEMHGNIRWGATGSGRAGRSVPEAAGAAR
jgi:hypothetical protein